MHAAAFRAHGGPEVLRWEEVADPVCGPSDVLVEVHACGVNHSDLDSRAGTSRWPFTYPWVLGAEPAGLVRDVGVEVSLVRPGDPVAVLQQWACGHCGPCGRWRSDLCERFTVLGTDRWGGYGELVRAPASAIVPLRSAEEIVTAAASQCVVSTAWSMTVSVARVEPGETVLVPSASGGVAGALVQCARLAGARVIATVGSAEKVDTVRALGADHVFSYADRPVREAVLDATDGHGVDAVLDTVGGPLFSEHLAALRPGGRLATCGAHAGEVVPLDLIELFRRGHRVLGFRLATPDELIRSLRLALDGAIRVPVAHTVAQADAGRAHELMQERRHVGKILLVRA